jgi:hypothetical protein
MCLLIIASSVTEYLVLDCVFLMMAGDVLESSSDVGPSRANAVLFVSIVGVLIAHEKWVEERVLGIPPAAEWIDAAGRVRRRMYPRNAGEESAIM